MSLRRVLLNLALRRFEKPHLAREPDPLRLRAGFERRARRLFRLPAGTDARWDEAGGVRALVLGTGGGPVLLYFHGGAFVMGSPCTHAAMVARLARLSGARAWLPAYRLAPEHPFPAAVKDAQAAYRGLLAQGVAPGRIVLGGDSAGGGLALSLLSWICTQGLPRPAGLFAFSPLTDLTFSGQSFRGNALRDPLLPAGRDRDLLAYYMRGADPVQPLASPLFAAFPGAPPVLLTVSDTEIMRDDSTRMARQLHAQGVPAVARVERGLPHVWPIFWRFLPEAEATLRHTAAWIRRLGSDES